MIKLETERLILRNYTMDDVPAVHEYVSSEEVSRYEDFWPLTVEEVAEGLSEWKDMDNCMAVVLKQTGELIGSVGYWDDEEDETEKRNTPLILISTRDSGTRDTPSRLQKRSCDISRKTCT